MKDETITSTITTGGATTVPSEIRKHLGLAKGDLVAYVVNDDGDVILKRARVVVDHGKAKKGGT